LSRWLSFIRLGGRLVRDFRVVIFVRDSSLLSVVGGIRVIPALVEETIIREAKRIRQIVLRVLRHGSDVRWVTKLLAK